MRPDRFPNLTVLSAVVAGLWVGGLSAEEVPPGGSAIAPPATAASPGASTGTPASVGTGSAPAAPLTGQAHTYRYLRYAASGIEQRIGLSTLVNPDCSSFGVAVGRILKAPQHGTFSFMPAQDFGTFAINSPRERCNDKAVPSLRVLYTSDAAYVGEDEGSVFLIFPDGSAAQWDFILDVR